MSGGCSRGNLRGVFCTGGVDRGQDLNVCLTRSRASFSKHFIRKGMVIIQTLYTYIPGSVEYAIHHISNDWNVIL